MKCSGWRTSSVSLIDFSIGNLIAAKSHLKNLPLHHFFTRYLFYFILKYVNEKRILTELRWPVKCFLAWHVDFCSINFNWQLSRE